MALIDIKTSSMPRLQLTAGYAEYVLGKHYNALGHLRQAMARREELSCRDRVFVDRLRDACDLKAGIIDTETYERRTDERTRALTGLESLEAQLEVCQYRCLRERNPEVRATLTAKIRGITHQIVNHPEATEAVGLGANLTHLYIQGIEANMEVTNQLAMSRMRASMFHAREKDVAGGHRQAVSQLAEWGKSSTAALKKAYELGHPILIGEAHAVVLSVYLGELMSQRVEALFYDKAFRIPEQTVSKLFQGITRALAIYDHNGSVEGRLRVKILKMDFLEIAGDLAAAKKLAEQIFPEADAMCFASFAERAKALLEDRTLLMQVERDVTRVKQTDEDFSIASQTDDEVQLFARDVVLSCGLPPSRLSVVEQSCRSLREVARERCSWCRHLDVLEEQPRTPDPATAYRVLPNQQCVCEKFDYETTIVTSDVRGLNDAFKHLYCANCKDRAPKQAPSHV
jgi:hypothetical protein